MNDFLFFGLSLLAVGVCMIASVILYEIVWKPRQRRRLERAHFRSKRSN